MTIAYARSTWWRRREWYATGLRNIPLAVLHSESGCTISRDVLLLVLENFGCAEFSGLLFDNGSTQTYHIAHWRTLIRNHSCQSNAIISVLLRCPEVPESAFGTYSTWRRGYYQHGSHSGLVSLAQRATDTDTLMRDFVSGTKVCRYNWHSAGSLGFPFPMLKYRYIFPIKYTEAILSNRFEISKILIAVLKIPCVIYYNFRHTFVSYTFSLWVTDGEWYSLLCLQVQ